MPPRTMEPATGAEMEQPKKRVASNGNILPDPICEGEILIDITTNQWKLGRSIGIGGFGEVYLASSNAYEPVGSDAQYVVKVEPHENGPLFVEMNCYLRVAKPDMIDEWKKSRKLNHIGLSRYIGSGSHVYRGQKYRFLVLERYGQDLDKLFIQTGRFPVKTVCYLGIQILDTLEYIHSRGYVHGDIKGPNLLLGYNKGTENYVHLLDFGIACRYLYRNGVHKEYVYDQRKAHAGTLKYVSRDAHIGAFSRRGDLETLSYNMIQWLCGKLPWEDKEDPEYIHSQKNSFMSNIPLLMRQCFPNSQPPAVLSQYLKYVSSLNFETKPSYAYCRNLLKQGVEDSGYVDDGKLVFGDSPLARIIENNNRGNKCRATDDPENATELKPKKRVHNTRQQACESNRIIQNSLSSVLQSYKQSNGKKIISGNPEKQVKKHARLNHKLLTIILAKYAPVVLIERLSNEVIQKYTASLPKVSELTKRRQQTVDTSSSFSNRRGHKRRATEDRENTAELKRKRRVHNTRQQACVSNRMIQNSPSSLLQSYKRINGKKIILDNPEKQVKKHARLNHKLLTIILAKYAPVVLRECLSNEVIQKYTASLLEVSELTKRRQQTFDTSSSFSNRIGHKRKATEDPENITELKHTKRVRNTLQHACASNRMIQNSPSSVLQSYKRINGKKIVSGNPKKQVKKHATLNCNLPSTIPTKYEPVVLIEHLPNEVIQKFGASLPEVSERTKQWQHTDDTSLFSNPTPAMLEIMLKMRQKESTPAAKLLNSAIMRTMVSKPNSS